MRVKPAKACKGLVEAAILVRGLPKCHPPLSCLLIKKDVLENRPQTQALAAPLEVQPGPGLFSNQASSSLTSE